MCMPLRRICLIASLSLTNACALFSGVQQQTALNLELGEQNIQMARYQDALAYLNKALSLEPKLGRAHAALGDYYLGINDPKQAAKHVQQALDQDPDNLLVQASYASYLCGSGATERGIHILLETVDAARNSQPWHAQTRLGQCFNQASNPDEAVHYLQKALEAKTDYWPALLAMQKISYTQHQYISAREYWLRYTQTGKSNADALWLAFQTERALGDAELSSVYRQQLLQEFPDSLQAQKIKNTISN